MHTLGRRDDSGEPGALILACHERIRRFVAAAARLAGDAPATTADVADTAGAVARYFREALPLHEADEDQSIAPRLTALGGDVADTVAVIAREHRELAAPIAALLAACDRLAAEPTVRDHVRPALAAAVAALSEIFARHLAREEAVMVPALAGLPLDQRLAIRLEMRARRQA